MKVNHSDWYVYHKLKLQLGMLREVHKEYPTSTIDSAMMQIESRIKCIEQRNNGSS